MKDNGGNNLLLAKWPTIETNNLTPKEGAKSQWTYISLGAGRSKTVFASC